MNLDTLFDAAIAGDADARTKLLMQADKLNEYGETILHTEAKNGNAERVRFILREFANKNLLTKITKYYKHTALHWAAYNGHTEVAEVLIDAARHLPPSADDTQVTSFQAFLRQGDHIMNTALHAAVKYGRVAIVKLIVEADPTDRHIQNDDGKTPMYIAVEKGYNDIVEIICTTCEAPSLDGPGGSTVVRVNDLDQVKSPGGTLFKIMDRYALYDAAIAGDADAIAKLEMEADKLNNDDETILHIESWHGKTECVRFLLKEFANKNLLVKVNKHKQTALHLAAYNGHTEVAEVLIDAARHLPNDDNHEYHDITSFQAFLRQGDNYGDTALHYAAEKGQVDIVKLIGEADPTDRHSQNIINGKTPMYIAVEKGYNNIVEIISKTCTAPSLDGPGGSTALHAGAKRNDKDVIRMIINAAKRSSTPQADAPHESFEALCTSSANDDIHDNMIRVESTSFQAFLRQGDENGDTALHLASYYEHTEVVEVLIEAARHLPSSSANDDNPVTSFQAFLRQGNKDMNTALHLAVKKGQVDIVKLFVEADPTDRHSQNDDGETPIYLAAERGYFDMVKIMFTTCTVPINLDGPGTTTALHAVIKNLDKDKKEERDLIRLIINAVKIVNIPEDAERFLSDQINRETDERVVQLFKKTDEDRCTILELAVERNYGDVVELILAENPAYQYYTYFRDMVDHDIVGLLPLIYKAGDKEYRDVLELLNERFERVRGLSFTMENMAPLLSAIRSHDLGTVLMLLDENDTKVLVNFIDDVGWTALHHAAYHEFNKVIKPIVEAQKKFGHEFVYPDKRPTPFHVAAQKGFTSTVILLFQLWPSSSSAYISIDKDGQNILHIAALQSKKEMIQAILKYCPEEEHKKELVNKQDNNGNTALHVLIRRGCLVPELLRCQGLDTTVKNNDGWTPPHMLYVEDEIIDDQVKIKIALDHHIQIDPKRDIFSSSVLSISKQEKKYAIMKKQANLMIHQMHARMKGDTGAFANCFADAIAGDPISKAALEMEADTLQEEGKTILHVESMRGVTERVEYILREFAIKNLLVKLDISKQTALHLAAHHGHTQVVEALIEAATHLPDDTHNPIRSFQDFIRRTDGQMGNTALHLAVFNGNVEIVKLLVQADPNDNHVQNNEGKTPIYIAAEKGYKDIVKEICTTCTALSVDGPGGRTTTLHALVQNAGQVLSEGASDMITMIVQAAKRWSTSSANYEALFCRTDELGSTVLQLAVERNYVSAVELILQEDPAYQQGREIKRNGLMRLIYKAIDKNCSDDIIKLLSKAYEAGIVDPDHEHVLALILAMKRRDEDSVLRLLGDAKGLVNFTEDNGWTPLHYAVYHEFDSILGAIIEAQEDVGHQFVYGDLVSTPFHVAIEHGYTSTLVRLIQLWPALSSASIADKSPYTVVNKDGQNILHLAASDNKKEMVQGILKYCPGTYKDKILKQQDINGDTPLHVLISQGCFIPELIKDEGLDTMAKNKNSLTPWEMLYFKNDVVADQVEIKIAIDDVQTNQSAWNLRAFAKSTEKKTDIWKRIPPSKRRIKDVMFDEQKIKLMDAKHEQRKKDLERYKMRTNTQIIVTALITTVTFTVGFTMPGGLRQSGEVDEGLALLSKKTAFNAFMISDALALLLSTSSLFFYFLESMNEDPRQVGKLNAASTVLNIVSVMAMMLTFIAGTYLVLSHSPALAITVCIIGSLFFLLIIFLLIKIVYDRLHVKRN